MKKCALIALALFSAAAADARTRWTEVEAAKWYAKYGWMVGSNYLPAYASNELEMWQKETFDPRRIDIELGWAQGLGMTTMRVFLHDLLWMQDSQGFKQRINTFLEICNRHKIRPIFVLFDSCWDPNPHTGPQPSPVPGVHNSRWVQSPGAKALADPAQARRLEAYVKGVVGTFAYDYRVLAWDVWNEPDNTNDSSYGKEEPRNKVALVLALLRQAFSWAQAANPDQPLTSGVWHGDWSNPANLQPMARLQLDSSDIISFHNYDPPEGFKASVNSLERLQRPIICTEYMARPRGSTFGAILPIAKQLKVGAVNWGFVAGKSQTYLPWDSWQHPYVKKPPKLWFHDIFRTDGIPYRPEEAVIIRSLTGTSH